MIIPSDYACNDFNYFARDGGFHTGAPYYFSVTFPHGCGDKPRYACRCATTCVPVQVLLYAGLFIFSQYLFLAATRCCLNLVGMVLIRRDRLPDYSLLLAGYAQAHAGCWRRC